MDLLIVPVPIFNADIAVEAYYFRHQKGIDMLEASRGTGLLDGIMNSAPLEMLNMISIDTFTMGKPIFVPINNYMLLASLENQTTQPPDKIIFLVDGNVKMEPEYLANMERLRSLGFRFAIQKISNADVYEPVLRQCSYIFYDHRIFEQAEQAKLRADIGVRYRHILSVYTHIESMEKFQELKKRYKGMFEGRFYRVPLTKGVTTVSPLQMNLINLINLVRDENFEFEDVTKIIQKDPALTVSLLRLVNSPYIGLRRKVNTISQAVTMLGQTEIRKWITTAVSRLLGADKPNEVTRLSLIRAKFAEELAMRFGMKEQAQGLFLMGLFSVLDAILEIAMPDALKLVHVSDNIYDALVEGKGDYNLVYQFMLQYESANWNAVSRTLILHDLTTNDIYNAYIGALGWYRDLMSDTAGAV